MNFVFTCGDINGIGPEIVIKTLNHLKQHSRNKIYFICPGNVFFDTALITPPNFKFEIIKNLKSSTHDPSTISVVSFGNVRQRLGRPTLYSGRAAFKSIKLALQLIAKKKADAIITAPISKSAIQKAGFNFPGHTEMLAKWFGVENYAMVFISKKINAALETIHVPLKKVPALIQKKQLSKKIELLIHTLKIDLGIANPKIAVLGLNPHAGEDGFLGIEEKKVIEPVIKNKRYQKHLSGPFPADAFWGNKHYKNFDLVLGMYHDQVLIPFKLLNFSSGVNFTAGLPIVRTSPDHGTAFDIAGKNSADFRSMIEAFHYAEKILSNRIKNEK